MPCPSRLTQPRALRLEHRSPRQDINAYDIPYEPHYGGYCRQMGSSGERRTASSIM